MKLRLLLIVFAFLGFSPAIAQTEFSASGYGVMRIENEYKLVVPDAIKDSLWKYLTTRYNNENLYLREIDSAFSVKIAEDHFSDQYFDNLEMQNIQGKNGVRHRLRKTLTDSTDRKNNRELMQVKINDISSNELNRGEYKFEVKHYDTLKDKHDSHPFLGLVKRKQREDITKLLKDNKIDALSLFPTIKVEQLRKRVYILLGDQPFATITEDFCEGIYEGKSCKFVELELELNEINYTESDSATRAKMEGINAQIKDDILKTFPSIKQDQTPKYNKAFTGLGLTGFTKPASPTSNYFIWIGVAAGALLVLFVGARMMRKRK